MLLADLDRAKTYILWAASPHEVRSSSSVLARAEQRDPSVHGDTIRYAYWILVNDGLLERRPNGVIRR